MQMDHPTIEDFEGFLRNASGPGRAARNARVVRHLVVECSSCRGRLREMGWGEKRLESLFRFPVDRDDTAEGAAPYEYGQAFAAAECALDAFFAEGEVAESTPDQLLEELAPLSQDEQIRRVTTYSRFVNPLLVHKLVEMSDAVRYESATRMLHLADLARRAAEACTIAIAGSAPKLADLRALGWRHTAMLTASLDGSVKPRRRSRARSDSVSREPAIRLCGPPFSAESALCASTNAGSMKRLRWPMRLVASTVSSARELWLPQTWFRRPSPRSMQVSLPPP